MKGKDIFERGTYEEVKSAEYLTEEFKGILESVFETECGLQTPEKIYGNIDFAIRQSLGDALISKGWIHIPGYIGSFPDKEAMIYNVLGNLGEELILAFFDRSSKGKSGVLITNYFLRIYAKGIFSNENTAYPIEQVKKIECQENDTYLVAMHNQKPVSFSMKRGDMTIEEQIAFGNILNDLVRMINNLYTERRIQLFRIFKHTKICRCGMLLLENEKICSSCKRMVKDNGEFVETQICPNCNSYVQKGKKFCSICGYQLYRNGDVSNVQETQDMQGSTDETTTPVNQEEIMIEMVCPNCHNVLRLGKKFCSKCGSKIQ